jgi:hypothetical protein
MRSAHLDASARHISLRTLGHMLQLAPSVLRLQILRDLVTPSEGSSPYMRTAAIRLVKEAVWKRFHTQSGECVRFSFTPTHVFRFDGPLKA